MKIGHQYFTVDVLIFYANLGIKKALLKERSPSCGEGFVYDGSFTGRLTSGDGVTVRLLKQNGIEIYGESKIEELL